MRLNGAVSQRIVHCVWTCTGPARPGSLKTQVGSAVRTNLGESARDMVREADPTNYELVEIDGLQALSPGYYMLYLCRVPRRSVSRRVCSRGKGVRDVGRPDVIGAW